MNLHLMNGEFNRIMEEMKTIQNDEIFQKTKSEMIKILDKSISKDMGKVRAEK